ncbi:MAG: AAA family ATPase [Sulfurovum sp.]|nr:AAA family ATPase [Sulfurovum sp.]
MGSEILELLIENSISLIDNCSVGYKRYFYDYLKEDIKLLGIIGARGTGKTTAILQYLKALQLPYHKKLYISADMVEISDVSLFEIAKEFEKYGGEILAIDEIHKNPNFEQELKNIYDRLNIRVIFSGSSAIKLEHSKADLSRRAIIKKVKNLSFREFLELSVGKSFKRYSVEDIVTNHTDIALSLKKEFKPLALFKEYLKAGAYPYYFEDKVRYKERLEATINVVIEVDIPSIFSIKFEHIINLKKLLKLLCNSKPYELNISALSQKIGIGRDKLYTYLHYLSKGSILLPIYQKNRGDSIFTKPAKLYLYNTNLYFAYCKNSEVGTIRESFFANAIVDMYDLNYANQGDFLVDETYTFEIGGKNKGFDQIKDIQNSFVVADDIEVGFGNKIPLWLFGFLY